MVLAAVRNESLKSTLETGYEWSPPSDDELASRLRNQTHDFQQHCCWLPIGIDVLWRTTVSWSFATTMWLAAWSVLGGTSMITTMNLTMSSMPFGFTSTVRRNGPGMLLNCQSIRWVTMGGSCAITPVIGARENSAPANEEIVAKYSTHSHVRGIMNQYTLTSDRNKNVLRLLHDLEGSSNTLTWSFQGKFVMLILYVGEWREQTQNR